MKNRIFGITSIVVLILAFTAGPALAIRADDIQSTHIAEADGVSGQDTNNGTGIKTGHIQDGAVTDEKISGPISAGKISSTGLDADTVDGLHASDLAPASHAHVTSEITGLDTSLAGKSDVAHNHAGTYAPAVHNHDGVYMKKYANVLVVAKSGGDFTDPVTAVNSITDSSATNPYLVKIMPGVYDIGAGTISMKPYVDVEGAGANVTVIAARNFGVMLSDDAELRSLTVEITNATYSEVAAITGSGGSLNYVTVLADDPGATVNGILLDRAGTTTLNNVSVYASSGMVWGIHITSGDADLHNVTVIAEGTGPSSQVDFGIWTENYGTVTMNNVDVFGTSCGIDNGGTSVTVRNSTIKGNYAFCNNGGTTKIAYSQVVGPVAVNAPTTCLGNYDENLSPVTCP